MLLIKFSERGPNSRIPETSKFVATVYVVKFRIYAAAAPEGAV